MYHVLARASVELKDKRLWQPGRDDGLIIDHIGTWSGHTGPPPSHCYDDGMTCQLEPFPT